MERVESMVFTSKSAEVKHLVLEFMGSCEQPVSRNDIVKYVQEHVSVDVTDGVIAGAIKMLTSAGEIIPVQRGIYVKGSGKVKATSFEKITNLCKRFQLDLERACTLNILELTDHEKEVYPDFIRCLSSLRSDVQLGASCLESLVDDVRDAELVDIVPVQMPNFLELDEQEEENETEVKETGLRAVEEITSEENKVAVDQPEETVENKADKEVEENETVEPETATEPEEVESSAGNTGRKRNRRNRH